MVGEEAEVVVNRLNTMAAQQAVLVQEALMTLPQPGMKAADLKKRTKKFAEHIAKLIED